MRYISLVELASIVILGLVGWYAVDVFYSKPLITPSNNGATLFGMIILLSAALNSKRI